MNTRSSPPSSLRFNLMDIASAYAADPEGALLSLQLTLEDGVLCEQHIQLVARLSTACANPTIDPATLVDAVNILGREGVVMAVEEKLVTIEGVALVFGHPSALREVQRKWLATAARFPSTGSDFGIGNNTATRESMPLHADVVPNVLPRQFENLVQAMPDGFVVLDADNRVIWSNDRLREWMHCETLCGQNFYVALGIPGIPSPDTCPFNRARVSGEPSSSTLHSGGMYYRVHAAPLRDDPAHTLVVTLCDMTTEVQKQQKLASVHSAGMKLSNLMPQEILRLTIDERIELLKQNILHFTQCLLHFDVVEIRLLDARTRRLEPLLAVGMSQAAAQRVLYAEAEGNGVTGFVAATGKSYLCEDTAPDPLYLDGCHGGRSSLTVPIKLHDEVIGTFNIESPEIRAFSDSDQEFLELFSRDVAVALNTMELLVVERAGAAAASIEAIHSAVAMSVDDILNDAVSVMERYLGHEPEVAERLQRILRGARDIKQVIRQAGQQIVPSQVPRQSCQVPERPKLRGKRILVVDADDSVRRAAHVLLDPYGCVVELANDGGEACFIVGNLAPGQRYDLIIADNYLSDMSGYELLIKLKGLLDSVPMVLISGFGFDPRSSIIRARQVGLISVLYKPFRVDQFLDTVEKHCSR